MTPEPVLSGNPQQYTEPWNPGGRISACFPCGALVRGDSWLVSYGWLDSECGSPKFPSPRSTRPWSESKEEFRNLGISGIS